MPWDPDAKHVVHLEAPVMGEMALAGSVVVVTLDRGVPGVSPVDGLGLAAFSRDTLAPRWAVWRMPPLAAASESTLYAYGRAGAVVAMDLDGNERWRAVVPDDRAAPAQARSDLAAPFAGDVLWAGDSLFVPAGREILELSTADGRVLRKSTACPGERGVVARLGWASAGTLVATCTGRTDRDDERSLPPFKPWQPPPPPGSHRRAPGEIRSFDRSLRERWRSGPPLDRVALGHRRPVVLDDGSIALLSARLAEDGGSRYLELFRSTLLVLENDGQGLRWWREVDGGYDQSDPVAVPGGVVAGVDPAFFSARSGELRWQIRGDRIGLDATIPATVVPGFLLAPSLDGRLLAVSLESGAVREVARFSPGSGCRVLAPLRIDDGRLVVAFAEGGIAHLALLPSPGWITDPGVGATEGNP